MGKALNYSDILLRHNKSIVKSRSECDISQKLGKYIFTAPVCCSNMKSILTYDICQVFDKRNWFYVYHRIETNIIDFVEFANQNLRITSISLGIKESDSNILLEIAGKGLKLDYLTIDVALSYTDNIIPIVKLAKKLFPEIYLIVGNGCTDEWIEFLESLNVDCAKVNIGVSNACRTRQFTGFGSSTVTSLIECVNAAKNIDIMADGGLTVKNNEVWIGDISKALVLGARFIMSGSLFSQCIDSPSVLNGYFGNASREAKGNKHVEGANIEVITNGLKISEMCDLVEDSLKSSVSYSGSKSLSGLINVQWNIV